MHEALRALGDLRPLRDPVLLAAFSGFTDPTGAAVHGVKSLINAWNAQPLVEIDPERFYDFTVQRPRVRLEEGERVLDWPENRFFVASPEGAERDFILVTGVEPHLRWRMFCAAIEDVLRTTGSTTSITLGAQPAAVPHTRPLPVRLSASDPEFETTFGLQAPASRYQGQTGIVGVLNVHLRSLGWRNASLWAMAPHYLTVGPNPNVAIQLISMVDHGFHTRTPLDALQQEAEEFERQVQQVLNESDEARTYVRQLEEQYDSNRPALPPSTPGIEPDPGLPSTPELLDDLERFLRDLRKDGQ